MKKFTVKANNYLQTETKGYYNCEYVGYQKSGNPDFINHLKNMSKKSNELDLVHDCIQTLLDFGAKNVILYVIAKTRT